ncbi:hypothetical protein E2C01_102054 [Portunus trituberculatus]|uniref:Uncharacterized protein n=1 Tax=Portunus trituberculatus TaxID=210409 RepID=A0A5B7KBK1_PORTR|nr:hypothetical protein [Portunus trituberculatus]
MLLPLLLPPPVKDSAGPSTPPFPSRRRLHAPRCCLRAYGIPDLISRALPCAR